MATELTLSREAVRTTSFSRVAMGVCVVVASALAMAATMPGRTQGLGIITKSLLTDFPAIDSVRFANINLVATLLGSLFCFPCGWLMDRVGTRPVLLGTMACLVATVMAMSRVTDAWTLAVLIMFTRGFGQSMLSVISITMMGKWFKRDAPLPMASYAVLMSVMMAVGFQAVIANVTAEGWRAAWNNIGIAIAILAPIATLLAFPPPGTTESGLRVDDATRFGANSRTDDDGKPYRTAVDDRTENHSNSAADNFASAQVKQALGTGCFWVFALAISFFGMISSGVSLFQQLILEERGLPVEVYKNAQGLGFMVGMSANLLGGWLARKVSMSKLLAFALLLVGGALATLPMLRTPAQAYAQTVVAAIGGGFITVLFFAVWSHAFGPKHLGRISSLAQMMTVVLSAVGPLIVAFGHGLTGSYLHVLTALAGVAVILAVASYFVNVPNARRGDWAGSARPAANTH